MMQHKLSLSGNFLATYAMADTVLRNYGKPGKTKNGRPNLTFTYNDALQATISIVYGSKQLSQDDYWDLVDDTFPKAWKTVNSDNAKTITEKRMRGLLGMCGYQPSLATPDAF